MKWGILSVVLLVVGLSGAAYSSTQATLTATATPAPCTFTTGVVTVTFSRARYPNIYQHYLDATSKGWPKILVLDRIGISGRRSRLLGPIPTKTGFDRDEYPPAEGREGWLADTEYVPSAENRSQGASLGGQLRGRCDGIRYSYDWSP